MFGGLLHCGLGSLLGSRSLRLGCGRLLVCLSCARDVGFGWFDFSLLVPSYGSYFACLIVLVVPVCEW